MMDKKFNQQLGITLSRLGFGCMRFPYRDGKIDKPLVKSMFDTAYQAGVNYYDTAYVYHDGASENLIGELLVDRYPRDSFYLADKLPGWKLPSQATIADMQAIFAEQLQRLHTDYIDFYLVHSLNLADWQQLRSCQITAFLDQLRQQGLVRHIGFSFHGQPAEILAIAADYDWDFIQLQINYYDWQEQDAAKSYQLAVQAGLPIVVMEPVRGGILAALPESAFAPLQAARPQDTAAAWALRWVSSLPQVLVTLSGMSNLEQMTENIRTYSDFTPLSPPESQAIAATLEQLRKDPPCPCTNCNYCLSECPAQLNIPETVQAAHIYRRFHNQQVLANYLRLLDREK
ncbi:MAG: aldo/keto reductase, partial [Clostridiales bacterium]